MAERPDPEPAPTAPLPAEQSAAPASESDVAAEAAAFGHAPDTSEFKVMIERKRRNDFVRRQELDFLRRVRRQGLSAAQAKALSGEADFQDSSQMSGTPGLAAEPAVLDKIADIERSMASKTAMDRRAARPPGGTGSGPGAGLLGQERAKPDAELDRAAMSFAAGDFDACELTLRRLVRADSARAEHQATWYALLDLYRALGQRQRFDAVAQEFVQRLSAAAPSWVAIPKLAQEVGAGLGPGLHLPGEQTYLGMAGHSMYDPKASSRFGATTLPAAQDEAHGITLELAGQLTGDISALMARADLALHTAVEIRVSLARVIRIDLVAAGELLQWVISKKSQQRQVSLTDAHRLVGLFLCAMGLDDQAPLFLRPL